MDAKVQVGISNRHVHLSKQTIEALFGSGYELTYRKDLSQPGQFASEETVKVIGPKGTLPKVRILGPLRSKTQVEVSLTDSFRLGIEAPIRDSGNLTNSPGAILEGPNGRVELTEGVIVALRHLHLYTTEAEELGLKDRDCIQIKTEGKRAVIFENVLVRVGPKFKKDLHLDTDEANAAGLKNGDLVTIVIK